MDNEYDPPRQRKKSKVKESIIDHTYRDYSQVEVSSDDEATTAGGDEKKQSRLQPNFPAKLHAIVSNPNYQHIICWQPHGRSWKIVDKHLLSTVICPKHFAHAKFESFNRSVNGWGFKRLLNPGPDCKSYYHECFLRGRPELTKLMQRLVNPGKRLPDKAGEPDFYEISRKYPLPEIASATPAQGQDVPGAALASPHHAARGGNQPGRYPFPPTQAAGYPYGYYPNPAYPQLPSPASGYGQAYPPQPPQQAYWPNQLPPSALYPPNPSAYGYYPYPQMMAPQGYDPQSFQHPSMYSQYYPNPTTPTAYANAASPGRTLKPVAGQAQAQQQPGQLDEHGQYPYPLPGARPGDRSGAGSEADVEDDRKPPARAGLKRSLEEAHAGGQADLYAPRATAPTHHLAGLDPSQHPTAAGMAQHPGAAGMAQHPGAAGMAAAAAGMAQHPGAAGMAAAAAARNAALEGVYSHAAYGEQQQQQQQQQPDVGATAAGAAATKPPGEGSTTATSRERQPGAAQSEEGGDGINEQQLLQDFFTHNPNF